MTQLTCVCPQAVFTREKAQFRAEYLRALHNEDRYKLALEDESVRRAYAALLAHTCPICKEMKRTFGTLKQLSEHVHKEHRLQYCDLCIEHLKVGTGQAWRRVQNIYPTVSECVLRS